MLYAPAHRMHAAADLGCKESAQRVYELLVRFSQGMAISWEGDFNQLTRVWTAHGVGNSESMDARAFTSTYAVSDVPRTFCEYADLSLEAERRIMLSMRG
jgi:hypothetical protein